MLRDTLKKLASEFGLFESEGGSNANVSSSALNADEYEKSVIDKLDRSVKFDEVDTVTFGLETDDGKIVKVYVNAEQAEEFEKALSAKLGEVDDIEKVLNELFKEYEIVDVEWPSEGDGNGDASGQADGAETGEDILDKKVFNKRNQSREEGDTIAKEEITLNFGEDATMSLLESSNSIESRFTTAAQLMVYHAIIDLGIPEIALARNPYRSAIIKGIKDTAAEVQRSASLKVALKNFIRHAVDFDKKAEENEQTEKDHHPHAHKPTEPEKKEEVKKEEQTMPISISEEAVQWNFSAEKDDVVIACRALKVTLGPEEVEKVVKGISNRDAVVVRDAEENQKKVVFSPRGSSVLVKKVGSPDGYMMSSKDIDELLSTISPEKVTESNASPESILDGEGNPVDPNKFYIYNAKNEILGKGYSSLSIAKAIAKDKYRFDVGFASGDAILSGKMND